MKTNDPFYFLKIAAISGVGLLIAGSCSFVRAGIFDPVEPEVPEYAMEGFVLREDLWTMERDKIHKELAGLKFAWMDGKEGASRSVAKAIEFRKHRVFETLLYFGRGKTLNRVELSLFNRGDAGAMNSRDFEKRVEQAKKEMAELTGVKEEVKLPESSMGKPTRRMEDSAIWKTKDSVFRLEWAQSELNPVETRPEFITLVVFRNDNRSDYDLSANREIQLNYFSLKKRIKTNADGDRYIEGVPMVDQGEKGYCAVASTERVLRYYGVDVNQHVMAQWADTGRSRGTSLEALFRALRQMGKELGFSLDVIEEMDGSDFERRIKDYNRLAKRAQAKMINFHNRFYGGSLEILADMDPEIYKQACLKSGVKLEKFESEILSKIDEGKPLLWGVFLGLVKEKPELPQAFGGHMRLIIGYNKLKRSLIYTDSWGTGHEYKSMPLSDAYIITTSLLTLELN